MSRQPVAPLLRHANTREHAVFAEEGPQPQILWEDEKLKVIVAGLKPGQEIPVHPEALAVYYFLEGNGTMTVDDAQFDVQAGATIVTPEGAARGVRAETQLIFLAARVG